MDPVSRIAGATILARRGGKLRMFPHRDHNDVTNPNTVLIRFESFIQLRIGVGDHDVFT